MKGIVFNEFTELVEQAFGDDMLDDIIEDCEEYLSTGGAYTAVSTYDHDELVHLVSALSKRSGVEVPELIETFGKHLAGVFSKKFPSFFEECSSSFEFFTKIDDHIHVEVHKLYPDAELPVFRYKQVGDDRFLLTYESSRHFSDLAYGLLLGVASFYQEEIEIEKEDFSTPEKAKVIFHIDRVA